MCLLRSTSHILPGVACFKKLPCQYVFAHTGCRGVAFCLQGAALYQVLFLILHEEGGGGGVVKLSTTRTWDS